MIYYFQIDDWNFFFRNHFFMVKNGYDLDKMVRYVQIRRFISLPEIEMYNVPFSYFSVFSWKKVSLKRKGEDIVFTQNIVSNFFHKHSHFEDNIFWFSNHSPFTLFYDGMEQKDDTLYLEHKNYSDYKKGFLDCPSNLIPLFFKEKIKDFCIKKYPYYQKELWSFLFTNSKQIYGRDLLKKCFHILGRFSKEYHFYQYHHSLFQKMEYQYLSIKHIHRMSKDILFPEFEYQTKKVQDELKDRWEKIYSFFQNELFSFLSNEEWNQTIVYADIVPFFQLPTFSLLMNIGKENIFKVLDKKKTYLIFFQIDKILKIKSKEPRKRILYNSSKEKLQNYVKKCITTIKWKIINLLGLKKRKMNYYIVYV